MMFLAEQSLTLTRRVTITAAHTVSIEALNTPFLGRVFPARTDALDTSDTAPRDAWPSRPLWYSPRQTVPAIGPAYRFTDGTITYETTGSTVAKRAGLSVLMNECPCLPVTTLYPLTGILTDQAGVTVQAGLTYALWGGVESHETMGDYEDFAGEAPVEYAAVVRRNTQIQTGGSTYRVLAVALDYGVPRVTFRVRRTERV